MYVCVFYAQSPRREFKRVRVVDRVRSESGKLTDAIDHVAVIQAVPVIVVG